MAGPRKKFDFDVVIIGGGMVGTCLAALLAREEALSGWQVALVDPFAAAQAGRAVARPPRLRALARIRAHPHRRARLGRDRAACIAL